MSQVPNPGHTHQATARTVFRVLGVLFALATLFCLIKAGTGLVAQFDDDSMMVDSGAPDFFLWWVGVVLLLIPTTLCLRAGFGGVALRYASGEAMPVVRDAAAYLTDGQGVAGIGRTVGEPTRAVAEESATGPYCRACGTRNDAAATFCDHCGASLA